MERIKVLIVDDHRVVREGLSEILKTKDNVHVLAEAQDGQEAVEKARSLLPDVILMDIGMPKLNGYDAARRIRQQPWGRDVLMVATTGWGKDEDRERSKEAGFDLHLVKPIAGTAVQELLSSPNRT